MEIFRIYFDTVASDKTESFGLNFKVRQRRQVSCVHNAKIEVGLFGLRNHKFAKHWCCAHGLVNCTHRFAKSYFCVSIKTSDKNIYVHILFSIARLWTQLTKIWQKLWKSSKMRLRNIHPVVLVTMKFIAEKSSSCFSFPLQRDEKFTWQHSDTSKK